MYSGTTLTPLSGRVMGAHQKIDRLARGLLKELLKKDRDFPAVKRILHFEGINGPDAIKRKSPAQDEPWHYYTPFDDKDTRLVVIIGDHYDRLVAALKARDDVRSSFEAAWLAHAIVDGLTPAHHYPYEEKLSELRGGKGLETRNTLKGKLVMPGANRRQQLRNNWNMWGPRGLLTTHGVFEWGIALMLKPLSSKQLELAASDVAELYEHGLLELFRLKAKEIGALDMYDKYLSSGWTPKLARQARKLLVPTIVHMVTLAWYAACIDAGVVKGKR
ncbi:MAG TPA: hypothetical protein VLH84_04435 [Patescibacteria group bacterium]|nr:hypothetical protein [Patescibacteria group bacterium]